MTLSLIKKEERKRETLLAREASTEMVVQMLGRGRYTEEFIARFCDVPVLDIQQHQGLLRTLPVLHPETDQARA